MSEPQDFIDTGDVFDPEQIEIYEQGLAKALEEAPNEARKILDRRNRAYAAVFNPGMRIQEDIDIVLADLMWFCKVRTSTFDKRDGIHAEELSKRKEGRREVFMRIQDFSKLSSDALFLMYTDAITR